MNSDMMGAVTRQQIEAFWSSVKRELSLSQTFAWTPAEPSICLDDRILLRESLVGRYPWEAYQEVLHEATHALCGGGHGRTFHDTFASLILRHLGHGGPVRWPEPE